MTEDRRDKIINKIVKERMESSSDEYFEDILRNGFSGFYDLDDENLETEIKEIMEKLEFEGSIDEFLGA